MIHMPQVLPELLPLLDRRFGAVTLFPLFPKDGKPAVRVIVQAGKGSRAGMRLLPGLVLHEADGGYTAKEATACVVIPTVNPDHVTPHSEAFQAVVWHLFVSHPKLKVNRTRWEGTK